MAKEPWEENVYDKGEKTLKRSLKSVDTKANRILTILAGIFFVVIVIMVLTLVYLSVGGSNAKKATEGFYSSGAAVAAASSSQEASSVEANTEGEEASSDETPQSSGPGTIQVLAGEGEASIAARAGISIAELERLNPSHMTQGYWYANPGDVVKTQ